MTFALVVFGVDAVLAVVLWWINRSGWATDNQRAYRRMKERHEQDEKAAQGRTRRRQG